MTIWELLDARLKSDLQVTGQVDNSMALGAIALAIHELAKAQQKLAVVDERARLGRL